MFKLTAVTRLALERMCAANCGLVSTWDAQIAQIDVTRIPLESECVDISKMLLTDEAGTITNDSGTCTESGNNLQACGTETINVTGLGTFNVHLNSAFQPGDASIAGVATSGGSALVTGSPKALIEGDNSIEVTGATGTITITLTVT